MLKNFLLLAIFNETDHGHESPKQETVFARQGM